MIISASLCHLHLVGSPSMVIAVAFYVHHMHPQTPVFPLDSLCRSYRNNVKPLQVSSFLMYVSYFDLNASSYSSSLLMFIGCLPICGNSALMGLLKGSTVGPGIPVPNYVDLIWSKAKFTSLLLCLHFFIVYFTSFIHASTCPLLLWWYDNVTALSLFRHLRDSLNFLEKIIVPASETNF